MKILISAPYMHKDRTIVEEYLKEYNWDVTWAPVEERLEEEDLLNLLSGYDGIICGDDRFTEKVYEKFKELKVVVKWGTGIDSINKPIAIKYGKKVYRTPGAFTVPVAETSLSYMLSFCRNVIPNDTILKSGGWEKPNGITLSECTVGIIGFGDIGQAVSKRLKAFGCRILVNDLKEISSDLAREHDVVVSTKDEIWKQSDIITLHTDLNEDSQHIINKQSILAMEKSPYIINTARGPLICEEDLIEALENNKIKGAGLDVFENEPLDINSPLRSSDKVILAAHNSNSSAHFWNKVHMNSLAMMKEGLDG